MNDDESTKEFNTAVLAMQVIVVALAGGIAMFAGFVSFQNGLDFTDLGVKGMFSWIAIAMGCVGLVLSRVVPQYLPHEGSIGSQAVAKPGEAGLRQRLLAGMTTRLIVGAALCEGMAFVNLGALMIERSIPCLGMAMLLLLAVLVLFPTKSSVAIALDDAERAAREEAQWK
jgi:heme exporter protein D